MTTRLRIVMKSADRHFALEDPVKGEVSEVSVALVDECGDVAEPVFDVIVDLSVSPAAADPEVVASGVKSEAPEFVGAASVLEAIVTLDASGHIEQCDEGDDMVAGGPGDIGDESVGAEPCGIKLLEQEVVSSHPEDEGEEVAMVGTEV